MSLDMDSVTHIGDDMYREYGKLKLPIARENNSYADPVGCTGLLWLVEEPKWFKFN